jgi:DNA-binding response OmpR family regulator
LAGPDNRAHADLRAMLKSAGYRVLTGRTVRQSISLLNAVSVVICEDILPGRMTWKNLLAALDHVHSAPAFIVTSAMVEPRLWAEVLNLGGSDVLAQPFSQAEVLWCVQHARSIHRTLPMACDLDSPAKLTPAMELPENGHRCALLGTDRHGASQKPSVLPLNRRSGSGSDWSGACSFSGGSQRSV